MKLNELEMHLYEMLLNNWEFMEHICIINGWLKFNCWAIDFLNLICEEKK